jgi:rubrerythrin
MRRHAPPPASIDNDPRNRRHSCGFAYNGYAWDGCPACQADENGEYALRCRDCRAAFFGVGAEATCPDCRSTDTAVIASPDE